MGWFGLLGDTVCLNLLRSHDYQTVKNIIVYGACVSMLSTVNYVLESVCTVEGSYAAEW